MYGHSFWNLCFIIRKRVKQHFSERCKFSLWCQMVCWSLCFLVHLTLQCPLKLCTVHIDSVFQVNISVAGIDGRIFLRLSCFCSLTSTICSVILWWLMSKHISDSSVKPKLNSYCSQSLKLCTVDESPQLSFTIGHQWWWRIHFPKGKLLLCITISTICIVTLTLWWLMRKHQHSTAQAKKNYMEA